jgi:hypothetical protein
LPPTARETAELRQNFVESIFEFFHISFREPGFALKLITQLKSGEATLIAEPFFVQGDER